MLEPLSLPFLLSFSLLLFLQLLLPCDLLLPLFLAFFLTLLLFPLFLIFIDLLFVPLDSFDRFDLLLVIIDNLMPRPLQLIFYVEGIGICLWLLVFYAKEVWLFSSFLSEGMLIRSFELITLQVFFIVFQYLLNTLKLLRVQSVGYLWQLIHTRFAIRICLHWVEVLVLKIDHLISRFLRWITRILWGHWHSFLLLGLKLKNQRIFILVLTTAHIVAGRQVKVWFWLLQVKVVVVFVQDLLLELN